MRCSAAAFVGAGSVLQAHPEFLLGSHTISTFVAHGMVGGLSGVIQGGHFGAGFLAAGIGSLAPAPVANETDAELTGHTVEAAILGGAGSILGGGKFQNGAITGAFGYLFNALSHVTNPPEACANNPCVDLSGYRSPDCALYPCGPAEDVTPAFIKNLDKLFPDLSGEISVMPLPDIPVGGVLSVDTRGVFVGVGGVAGESAQGGANMDISNTNSTFGDPWGPAIRFSSTAPLNPGVGTTVTKTYTFYGSSQSTSVGPTFGGSASATVGWQW